MRPPKDLVINGAKYRIGLLPLSQAEEIHLKLLKNFGPAMSEGIEGMTQMRKVIAGVPMGALAGFLREISTRVNLADLRDIRKAFGGVTERDGTRLDFDVQELVFTGEMMEMYSWLKEAVEHNYADFFTSVRLALTSYTITQSQKAKVE